MNSNQTSCNILIIDDIPNNIKVAANILQQKDYKLFFATSGSSALEKMQSTSFDLILLDVMMPEMDGFDVCTRIRSNPHTRNIPVIFLTAKTDTESVVKGFEVGGTDYVTKPFHSAELLARVKTHLELSRAKAELYTLNATKDKFFSIIAHDLRNPFTTLLGLTDILDTQFEEYDQEQVKKMISSLKASVKKTFTLVENLLTWSRLQRGMMESHPELLPLHEIAMTSMYIFQPRADYKQIALTNTVSQEIHVYADRMMVDTILRNLISNALKFTDAEGTVIVAARSVADMVEIAVSDTGIGISEDAISKLFRIDTKYSKPGTAGEEGTGLGLVLCKELVEKNGGHIGVESDGENGTTFYFTLPAPGPRLSHLSKM